MGNRPWTGLDPMGLSIRSLYYGEAYGLDFYPSSNTPMPPRMQGTIGLIGAILEGIGGASLATGGTFTVVGSIPAGIAGGAIGLHATDSFWANWSLIWTGKPTRTLTAQIGTHLTGSERGGDYIDLGLGFLDMGVGGISYVTRSGKLAGTADHVLSCTDEVAEVSDAGKYYRHTTIGGRSAITDGKYIVNPHSMDPHKPGTALPGKSVFRSDVDAERATLDAARYADERNLWNADGKAKVPVQNGPVGYLGEDGSPTSTMNVYRNKRGLIHATPGNEL